MKQPATIPKLLKKAHYKYYIGIDPGVNTGFAFWGKEKKTFANILTLSIHQAMLIITGINEQDTMQDTLIRIEDARKRKWFGDAGREQLQGAGSIKRDCKIWEDFLTDLQIPFEMVAPKKGTTKWDAKTFKKITGWQGRTTEHARDAAILVYGL